MGNNKNITKSISIRSKNSNVSNLLNSVNESQLSRDSFKVNYKIYGQKSYITEANKIMKERMKNKGNAITSKHRMRNIVMNDTNKSIKR